MTTVDWIAVVVIVLAAVAGLRRGLVTSVLSAAGIVGGAILGARIAPHLLSGGAASPYTPLAGLVGAAIGATLLEMLGTLAGSFVRGSLRLTPLRALDSAGGVVAGLVGGLALVWVLGAVALLLPGQTRLRRAVVRSTIVRRLDEAVSPRSLLNALARIDPLPSIVGPAPPAQAPDPSILADRSTRAAARSVVKVLGTTCGVGVEGSGWVARTGLVVTAAHVVAGERDTVVQQAGSSQTFRARAVVFDVHDDIAVLRVERLPARALAVADPRPGAAVAIVGYPQNGPLTAVPGRIGRTAVAVSQDAYGHGPVARTITSISGRIRHGNSGGPAIDRRGAVEATIFAARIGSPSGFGVPTAVVRRQLARAGARTVSTGGCAA
jgi:uncharacterized membrane protein required for colicin V production